MNHIGAKTEAAPSAWDQLAQTQNYEHPVRQAPQLNAKSPVNNQTPMTPTQQSPPPQTIQQSPLPPVQQQTDQNKPPEYGEELHPELVIRV
jgi:hypothetical protein